MRLRLRSFESKQTLKIEVPNPCTLSQLKQILVQSFRDSPSPDSIRLSLNRKDELQSDGGDSLQSLGVAAGDLIYFSLEQSAAEAMIPNPRIFLPQVTQNALPDSAISGIDSEKGESSVRVSEMEETIEKMEVDDEDIIETDVIVVKSLSVPGFLRKVFIAELGNDPGKDHKLIIIAIHAVMLETGFVGFDKKANIVVNGFSFSNEWPSSLFNVSLCYTLQESLSNAGSGKTVKKSIVLKFQTLGKFINVYGTLENGPGKKNSTYRVQLDEDQLVSFLNVVWANCGEEAGGVFCLLEKKVFEFWRTVKDNIALPLLIDLCEEIGLPLPPCFMRLPTDLKMKILEYLPGVDVAKASCVCSELRYLGSSDDLWKIKFGEEFGDAKTHVQGSWKKGFAMEMESRNRIRKFNRARERREAWPETNWAQRRRYPNPFMVPRVPRIIGGDYDIMGNFAPDCNFRFLG
ncbi:hypothetical protein CASFOL_035977 [Castilleja foliolosa]|uniref:F-box family protein n=1 Tax=Castilleja foliolosa TaxID=1961234 RepID=A0ABD3BUB9_9LAMI